MKLGSFTSVLWERRWFVAGVLVLALIMSPFLISMTRPTYTATSEVTTVGNPTNSVSLRHRFTGSDFKRRCYGAR